MKQDDYVKLGKLLRMSLIASKKLGQDDWCYQSLGYDHTYYIVVCVEGLDDGYGCGTISVIDAKGSTVDELWEDAIPKFIKLYHERKDYL